MGRELCAVEDPLVLETSSCCMFLRLKHKNMHVIMNVFHLVPSFTPPPPPPHYIIRVKGLFTTKNIKVNRSCDRSVVRCMLLLVHAEVLSF